MTNDEKLKQARELVFEVWDDLVPDRPDADDRYDDINRIAERTIYDLQEIQVYVDDSNHPTV